MGSRYGRGEIIAVRSIWTVITMACLKRRRWDVREALMLTALRGREKIAYEVGGHLGQRCKVFVLTGNMVAKWTSEPAEAMLLKNRKM